MMDYISEHKRYFITATIGLVISIFVCSIEDVFSADSINRVIAIISDAFLVPGIVFLACGIIMYAGNEGLFNAMTYGFKILGKSLTAKKDEKIIEEEFHEYHTRAQAKQNRVSHLIVVGVIFIALSILFTVLYLNL